jgi:hypothetical protein
MNSHFDFNKIQAQRTNATFPAGSTEPEILPFKILTCVRRKMGNHVSIKLIMRAHDAE